jgi:type I restriction enzyme S subunit
MSANSVTIGDLCDFVGGSQPPKSDFIFEPRDGYVRLIQTRDYKTDEYPTYIPAESTKKFCTRDDIMIGRYGPPIFQICRGLEGAYNVALMKAIPKDCISKEYLFYLLKQPAILEYVEKLSLRTGGQTGVDLTSLRNYPIRLPTMEDQRKVERVLGDLDAKIVVNSQINAELQGIIKLLYELWFVQFDFPLSESQAHKLGSSRLVGKSYRATGGKMVYDDRLKRDIPSYWSSGEAKDLFIFNPTLSLKDGEVSSYLDMDAVPTRGFMTKRPQQRAFTSGTKFVNGDVVVARITPCLENGKTALITQLEDGQIGFGSTEFIVIRGKTRPLSALAACIARSEHFRRFAILNMTGTSGRKRIEASVLKTFPFPIPPDDLLSEFEDICHPMFHQMTVNEVQNQELTALRDWLLPLLMNGQVKVR